MGVILYLILSRGTAAIRVFVNSEKEPFSMCLEEAATWSSLRSKQKSENEVYFQTLLFYL